MLTTHKYVFMFRMYGIVSDQPAFGILLAPAKGSPKAFALTA